MERARQGDVQPLSANAPSSPPAGHTHEEEPDGTCHWLLRGGRGASFRGRPHYGAQVGWWGCSAVQVRAVTHQQSLPCFTGALFHLRCPTW